MGKISDNRENLERFRNEYNQKVFEAYNDKSKDFYRSFTLPLAFGMIFFFIILLPYIFIQDKDYRLTQQIDSISIQINQTEKSIEGVQRAQQGIQLLLGEIDKAPSTLRQFITDLQGIENVSAANIDTTSRTTIQQQQVLSLPSTAFPECGDLLSSGNKDNWINCNVQHKVQNLINLQTGVNSLENTFNEILRSNPRFWECYDCPQRMINGSQVQEQPVSKLGFRDIITLEAEQFWQRYGSPIEKEIEDRGPVLTKLKQAREELEQNKVQLNNTKTKIADRLSQIEFPFGKVPIGLGEANAAFPLALGAGFLICSQSLRQAIRLRKELYEWYRNKWSSFKAGILPSQKITLIAPLWIEPTSPLYHRTVKFAVLLIPLVIFVVSWILILHSWSISNIKDIEEVFPYDRDLVKSAYNILYIMSLGFFIFGIVSIIKDLRRSSVER